MTDDDRDVQHKADPRGPLISGLYAPDEPRRAPERAPVATPVVSPAPAPVVAPVPVAPPLVAPPLIADSPAILDDPAMSDDDLDEEASPRTLVERIRTLQPLPVILGIASLGSFAFLVNAATSHITPVSVLMSAGVVAAIVFGVAAVAAAMATLRASREERTGKALILALTGGFAALVAAGAFSGVLVMFLVLNG
jgi:hypothetical protein